jgi:hypothetical protein
VQVIPAIVGGEPVFVPVEVESAASDPVRITADHAAEKMLVFQVLLKGVEAEDHVDLPTLAVGQKQRLNDGTVVDDPRFQPAPVPEDEQLDRGPFGCLPKGVAFNGCHELSRAGRVP